MTRECVTELALLYIARSQQSPASTLASEMDAKLAMQYLAAGGRVWKGAHTIFKDTSVLSYSGVNDKTAIPAFIARGLGDIKQAEQPSPGRATSTVKDKDEQTEAKRAGTPKQGVRKLGLVQGKHNYPCIKSSLTSSSIIQGPAFPLLGLPPLALV
eukprot:TRINITY_DN33989_c0_g1_i1.p1 TRINITY_DN33989_c0_g1~~TRINITY_DN33989_c0_g1_i1.p1  ORF type:complete len:156 (+),score=35.51 TRINITY_DN33989_c0_g1_i1:230-697(+)